VPLAVGTIFALTSCSTLWKDYDAKLLENKEFDNQVKITEMAPAATATEPAAKGKAAAPSPVGAGPVKAPVKKTPRSKKEKTKTQQAAAPAGPAKHEPPLEDGEGFDGRRPNVDPFTENEKLSYIVSYFGAEAGKFTTTIGPFVQVNGKKAYRMSYSAHSSSVFSLFYAVDDKAETFVDYANLVPFGYTITARESKQVRDVKNFFNWQTMKVKHWDKKLKKGAKEPEEKNLEWDLLPYSQNVFSVPFYLRTFTMAVGKEFAVRVAHEGSNIIMRAKVLREEQLSTPVGKMDTWVLKPEFEINGAFKPVGDVFLWLSKDEHKYLVRIESKIKIGKIVVSLDKIGP
jgi:hypothetical protein